MVPLTHRPIHTSAGVPYAGWPNPVTTRWVGEPVKLTLGAPLTRASNKKVQTAAWGFTERLTSKPLLLPKKVRIIYDMRFQTKISYIFSSTKKDTLIMLLLLLKCKTRIGTRNWNINHCAASLRSVLIRFHQETPAALTGLGMMVRGEFWQLKYNPIQRCKEKVLKINFNFKVLLRADLSPTPRIQSTFISYTLVPNSPPSKGKCGERTVRDNLATPGRVHGDLSKIQYSQKPLKWPVRPYSLRQYQKTHLPCSILTAPQQVATEKYTLYLYIKLSRQSCHCSSTLLTAKVIRQVE